MSIGSPVVAKKIRELFGVDGFKRRTTGLTIEQAVEATRTLVETIDCIDVVRGVLGDMCSCRWLITSLEFSYFTGANDLSFDYVGMFVPREIAVQFAADEDYYCYMVDAASELEMLKGDTDRLPRIVSRDDTQLTPYVNMICKRFPLFEISNMDSAARDTLANEYVWVQIRPVKFGIKTAAMMSWIKGLM
jgi:hypothetical protein